MSQRLTTAAAIVMACACLAMFALVWRSIGNQQDFMTTQQQHIDALTLQMQQDADDATRQREQLQELLAESQELNRELTASGAQAGATETTLAEARAAIETLTERLSEMEARASDENSDWNPVEFRLVQGSEDGPPAVGFSVAMRITTPETGIPPNTAESDEAGMVRFERVRYGAYDVTITAPWREYCHRQILLQPGESHSDAVICPAAEPEPLVAELAVEWPEDLAGQPIFMNVDPSETLRMLGGDAWSGSPPRVASRGGFRRGGDLAVWVAPSGVIHRASTPLDIRLDPLFVASEVEAEAVRAIRWRGADYRVTEVAFHAPQRSDDRARYVDGEPMSDETRLSQLVRLRGDRDQLTWRVEEGTPNRIVLLPSPETVAAVRDKLALLEEAESGDRDARQSFFSGFGGRIVRLPPPLMNTDLATVEP